MKMNITYDAKDIKMIQSVVELQTNATFLKNRIAVMKKPKITKEIFWKSIIMGLLTSQQKSSPNSPINKILSTKPFIFGLNQLDVGNKKLQQLIIQKMNSKSGIRFVNVISLRIFENYNIFMNEWIDLEKRSKQIIKMKGRERINAEREFAFHLQDLFVGIGPKQSRNILQFLGIALYEIPIDSRSMKWIHQNLSFPFPLNAKIMINEEYYCFVLNFIQNICDKAKVRPAIFDAAVFSSFRETKGS